MKFSRFGLVISLFVITAVSNGSADRIHGDGESIVSLESQAYSYSRMMSDLNFLCTKYPDKIRLEYIGKSVLSRNIPAVILGNQNPAARNRILIIGNMHAREIHSAPIIVKQIEFYLQSWNNTYQGKTVSDIFINSALYCIPTANPDGNAIVMDGLACIRDSRNDWNGGESIPDNYPLRDSLVAKIKESIVRDTFRVQHQKLNAADYRFDGKDLIFYKANANGVDLHYNFYEKDVNQDYVADFSRKNPGTFSAGPFSAEGYCGDSGIDQPESGAVRNFIEKYRLFEYSITYHGRMPAVYYDYTRNWDFPSAQTQRDSFRKTAIDLGRFSDSPVNGVRNGPIGFCGWYEQKYHGLSLNIETGYAKFNGKNAYCPIPAEQLPAIWKAQRYVPLHLLMAIQESSNLKIEERKSGLK